MNTFKTKSSLLLRNLAAIALLTAFGCSYADTLGAMVDDFSDAQNNNFGMPRQFINDSIAGGGTTTIQDTTDGILSIKGDIVPPRGQPGWASTVLLLDSQGLPQDLSAFEGVRLLIKINKGNITLSANSTDIANFDYHAAPVVATSDGKFHEVNVSFASMKRAWSEQTPLDTKTINGLSIVAFDVQPGSFDFEIDEVNFY